jgi:hypothetical protein
VAGVDGRIVGSPVSRSVGLAAGTTARPTTTSASRNAAPSARISQSRLELRPVGDGGVTWGCPAARRSASRTASAALAKDPPRAPNAGADQQRWSRYGRFWSQVVAVALGVPANMVAIWSQSSDPTAVSDPMTGPLTSSQPSPVPAGPSRPSTSLLILVNSRLGGPSRASVPACHAWHGRNVVAGSGRRRQTGSLVTRRSRGRAESRAPD